jgi:hypothetical protein
MLGGTARHGCVRTRPISHSEKLPMLRIKGIASVLGAALVLAGAAQPASAATCTATNPCLSVRDVTLTEGDSGIRYAHFYVDATSPRSNYVTFEFKTTDGTARGGNATSTTADYVVLPAGIDGFAPGDGPQVISVVVFGDQKTEPNESFFLDLTRVSGGQIVDGRGQATIVTDDKPTISVGNASIVEGDSAQKIMLFPVTLSETHSDKIVYVDFATANGTAVANSDYWPTSGQLAWMPETLTLTQYIGVTIFPDRDDEANESFTLHLSNVIDGSIGDGQGVGTIVDNDQEVGPPPCPPSLPNCHEQ